MYPSLYCKGSKRVTQGFTVRGSWRPNNCNVLTPTLMVVIVVSLSFSRTAQLEAQGPSSLLDAGFLYCILSPTCLQNSIGGPEGPFNRVWLSLPHLVSDVSDPQLSDFLFSPNYVIVESPTQYLEWPVWSSSSGNNCHAVHRSLSSSASVYECTMGILPCPRGVMVKAMNCGIVVPCPILLAKSTYAISSHNCHRNVSLPSGASLWNGIFARAVGLYITQFYLTYSLDPISYYCSLPSQLGL